MKDEHDKDAANEAENIRVAVRCRPMNDRETREKSSTCFTVEDNTAVLTNLDNPAERHEFGFDHVYGIDVPQVQVFHDIGEPILDRAFGGYNGTIFAYGQTGSGKTFSMSGVRGHDVLEGLIPRMNRAIFERVQREKEENPQKLFLVECSFFEIYNEIIYDLLDSSGNNKKNKGGLEIKEHAVLGIYVKDLQERVVESREEVIDLMQQGQNARTVGATQMNAESSRSHSIFIIKIHQKDSIDETKNIFAKINLVDLAGSERAASTGAQGDRLKEGANINKSLSALGNVINALVEASRSNKKIFIPYRNSKLTRVLQESLGGNSLCSMLATLSPANINFIETLSTLKYASRAKSIKVNAKKNEASSQISQLNDEIATLKKKLTEQTSATLGLDPKEKEEIVKKYEQQIKEMDRVRLQTWEDKAKQSKQHELERKKLAKERALADQKIREERTRKWKLLEEKGDVELMLRALRDLDRSAAAAASGATSSGSGGTSCTVTSEDKWLAKAQAMKTLEAEAKDHRTMILVFKDSVDKDVDQWAKRLVRNDATTTTTAAAKRDDTAATHMIVNQLCSKLQNVFDESKQLVQMEKRLVDDGVELINEMMSELIQFKEKRKLAKVVAAVAVKQPVADPQRAGAKEEEQLCEEREKGLSMTLALVQRQRAKLVTAIRSDHQKMFQLTKVTTHFTKYMDSYITAIGSMATATTAAANSSSAVEGPPSLEKWTCAKNNLVKASTAWENEWAKIKKLEATAPDAIAVTYVPKGDVAALGLESKLIGDESLYASSRKSDAKHMRMNSAQFWVPDEQDTVPFLVVDLEFPRVVKSLMIRGGNTSGSPPIALPASSGSHGVIKSLIESNQREAAVAAPVPVTTFQLKPCDELKEILKKYTLSELTGDYESTYEILGDVMSWMDLLKTALLPNKLFVRPPIRFIHDVISVVIHNTGFAKDLYSASEKDYATTMNNKTERADYLTKILDFVQEWYRAKEIEQGGSGPAVVIAATASNILAGKEPTDTLKFLCYLAIAAMESAVKAASNSDAKATTASSPCGQPETQEASEAVGTGSDNQEASTGRSGWVKKIRVSTSLTGKQWCVLGDFDANTDDVSLSTITFPSDTNAVGRFVQLTCIEWHELPLFQVEIFGQEASESNELAKTVDAMGAKASDVVHQLLSSASLFAEEARASWEKAKDAEREKQEQQIKLVAEITRLKQANLDFEKQIKELQTAKNVLSQNVKNETKNVTDEKLKVEKLQLDLQQTATELADLKKEKDTLGVRVNEQAHALQTATLQLSEQRKELESSHKSKTDLEDLCATLRTQVQSKTQEDAGHQESKLATVTSELMALNVQLEEGKRRYETSEQMRKEQDAANQQMHKQLQDQLTQLTEKERSAQSLLHDKVVEAGRLLEVVQTEKDELRKRLEECVGSETAAKTSSEALRLQVDALRDELESYKQQERGSKTDSVADGANTVSNNSASAQASEQMMLDAQTKELRCIAEMEKMEVKMQSCEQKQRDAEAKVAEVEAERNALARRMAELEEQDDELQMQLQVVTEERDAARSKEEQLFVENNEKEQEIERIRDGYVWVTDRMNSKEDELAELQDQLEKYQALLQITTPAKAKQATGGDDSAYLVKLYTLATGKSDKLPSRPEELMKELSRWIELVKKPVDNCVSTSGGQQSSASVSAPTSSPQPLPKQSSLESNGATATSETAGVGQPPSDKKQSAEPSLPPINVSIATATATTSRVSTQEVALPESPSSQVPVKTPRDVAKAETPAPIKPTTPRREPSPATTARKISDATSTNTSGTSSNQSSQRTENGGDGGGDEAYDDDFDADEAGDTESKRQLRRKASEKQT